MILNLNLNLKLSFWPLAVAIKVGSWKYWVVNKLNYEQQNGQVEMLKGSN